MNSILDKAKASLERAAHDATKVAHEAVALVNDAKDGRSKEAAHHAAAIAHTAASGAWHHYRVWTDQHDGPDRTDKEHV